MTRQSLSNLSLEELQQRVMENNFETAGIDVRNKRRLVRLLETGGAIPTKASSMRTDTLVIGIKLPRAKLRANIEKRVESMFRGGLKHEVKKLADNYGWECEALKGIGYREFKDYFAGGQSLAATKRKIVKSTLDLAKRQRTWFKRNLEIKWVEDLESAKQTVKTFLNS